MPGSDRCPVAIALGWYPGVATGPAEAPGLHSRCMVDADLRHAEHEARGLAEFDYQRWHWFAGDRRAYETERDDEFAWEQP